MAVADVTHREGTLPEAPGGGWVWDQLSLAIQLFREFGDAREAFAPIDAVLARHHDDPWARELGYMIAGQSGDMARLVYYSGIFLAVDPNRSSNQVRMAEALLKAGVPDAAIDVIDPLIEQQPSSTTALGLKIKALLALGDGQATDGFLDELAKRSRPPVDASLVDWLAGFLGTLGETQRALAWISRPWPFGSAASLALRRGRLLYAAGRYEEALTEFTRCETDEPDLRRRIEASVFKARVLRNMGRNGDSAQAYMKVHENTPENEEAAEAVFRYCLAQKDRSAAVETLARFEKAAPRAPAATWMGAALAVADTDTDRAVALYRDAIAAQPALIEHYCRFADLLADLGDIDQMHGVLTEAGRRAPESPRVLARRLRCANLRGAMPPEVLELCDSFLTIEPENENAMLHRGNALLRAGQGMAALNQYVVGARTHKRNINFWRAAISLASNLNRHEQTRELFSEVSRIFSTHTLEDLTARADIYEAGIRRAVYAVAAPFLEEAIQAADAACSLDANAVGPNRIAARLRAGRGEFARAWRHLKILHEVPNPPIDTVRLFAQVAAGFRYLRPSQADLVEIEPIELTFPDILFEEMVARSPVEPLEACTDVVLHVSSTLASGGAERQAALTVDHFARRAGAVPVEFVADDLDPAHGRDFFLPIVKRAGVPIRLLRDLRETGSWRDLLAHEPHRREAVRVLGALPRDLARMALPLFTLFCDRKPRVVHLWQDMVCVAGGIAAVLAGVPRVVMGIRSTRPVEQQRSRPYFRAAYSVFLKRPGIDMIANSRNGARDYEDWLGLPEGRVGTIFNGYDFAEMRERARGDVGAAMRREADLPADAIVLGGIMRCSFEKRPELWTAAACELAKRDRRVHAILVGDGPMRAELIQDVERQGLSGRIKFVGRKAPIEPWIRAMDALFLSSVTEGLPNVLIEAQSLGVPVATMRVGGAPETVEENKTAVVIDEGSTEEVASAIATLLLDPDRRHVYGAAGIAWTDRAFSIDAVVNQLLALYRGDATPEQ